jgi:DNA invertase Pin-like site-specific DNA recombinase
MTIPKSPLLGALYVRSASSAPEDADDVDVQRFQVEQAALRDEVEVVMFYEDLGVSGLSTLKQRPGLVTLLEDARRGEFNVLYLAGLDRLGRRTEHVQEIVGQLLAAGVKIRVGQQGEIPDPR